jgi:hypothetical protein
VWAESTRSHQGWAGRHLQSRGYQPEQEAAWSTLWNGNNKHPLHGLLPNTLFMGCYHPHLPVECSNLHLFTHPNLLISDDFHQKEAIQTSSMSAYADSYYLHQEEYTGRRIHPGQKIKGSVWAPKTSKWICLGKDRNQTAVLLMTMELKEPYKRHNTQRMTQKPKPRTLGRDAQILT